MVQKGAGDMRGNLSDSVEKMAAKITDLRNEKHPESNAEFRIDLTARNRKDVDALSRFIGRLREGKIKIALGYSTDGKSGVIYLDCE